MLCIYELLIISFYIFACSSLCVYKLNIVESICVYWNIITKHFFFLFDFFFFFCFSTFLYINKNAMEMLCTFKNFIIKCLFRLQLLRSVLTFLLGPSFCRLTDWALLDCVIDRKMQDIIFEAILSPSGTLPEIFRIILNIIAFYHLG